jgi:spore coat protein U-like protein
MKRLSAHCIRLLVVAAVAASASIASAQDRTTSAPMPVSAVVSPNCRVTLTPLSFGAYDPLGVNSGNSLDATTRMLLLCTRGSRATINLDRGKNGAGDRRLSSGDARLAYEIFQDPSRTRVWGNGAEAYSLEVTANGLVPREVTVFGRIPPGQAVPSGIYSDVITATVDF